MRNVIRKNALANLFGYAWAIALQLFLTPFYIHYLGIESYALIGFYLMLIAAVQIFDFGLSQTLNREMSRLSVNPQDFTQARDVLRTLEFVYWPVVAVVCSLLLMLTPLLARNFLNAAALPQQVVTTSVSTMALVVALQWPITFYSSGLMGLQRQVLANTLRVIVSTVTGIGTILVILLVSRSITAFFYWQAICAALALVCFGFALYGSLPAATIRAGFRSEVLGRVWRFATGITAITLSALVLTQFDKWILAKMLSLAAFGYFMLAVTVAGGLNLLVTPLFNAVFPRFSGLVAEQKEETLLALFHMATQAMAVFLLPLALGVSLFANEVLYLWTGNLEVARYSGPILAILVLGTALNGLFHIPYALALARAQTRFIVLMNFAAIAVLVPAVWYFASRYGAIVAAFSWLALNLSYLFVYVPLVRRQFGSKERVRWMVRDIGSPLVISAAVLGLARIVLPDGLGRLALAGFIAFTLGLTVSITLALSPQVRRVACEIFARKIDPVPNRGQ